MKDDNEILFFLLSSTEKHGWDFGYILTFLCDQIFIFYRCISLYGHVHFFVDEENPVNPFKAHDRISWMLANVRHQHRLHNSFIRSITSSITNF